MRKIIYLFVLSVFLISLVSSEIIIEKTMDEIYNLGDSFDIPVVIKSAVGLSGLFQMNLICNGVETNFYKNGIVLVAGAEKKIESGLILSPEVIGNQRGDCKIKGILDGDYVLSNQFKISDLIVLNLETTEREFKPSQSIVFRGTAIKENSKASSGWLNLKFTHESGEVKLEQISSISEGNFNAEISFPSNLESGTYALELEAYELDEDDEKTNIGTTSVNLLIQQIPTSFEIVFENDEIEPGTDLSVKLVLHDQTGKPMEASSILTVKDEKDKILSQVEILTGELFSFSVESFTPPAKWKVYAVSNKLSAESTFEILKVEKVGIEIINQTLILTNQGNVPYNKTVLVKIGEELVNVKPYLAVQESRRYTLTAPKGEYQIEVYDDDNSVSSAVSLTGKVISVKEIGASNSLTKIIVWLFVIVILGITVFIFAKKGYQKSFIGRLKDIKFKKKVDKKPLNYSGLLLGSNSELSLSIRGERQKNGVVCLKLNNYSEILKNKSNVSATLQSIITLAEERKLKIYENSDYVFFIASPVVTRSFKHERLLIDFAFDVKNILDKHNTLFKQIFDYGLSVHIGEMISKIEEGRLVFMSLGSFMSKAKKIASLSRSEILISEEMKNASRSEIRTEKETKSGTDFYKIKSLRHKSDDKFISRFIKSLEGKN